VCSPTVGLTTQARSQAPRALVTSAVGDDSRTRPAYFSALLTDARLRAQFGAAFTKTEKPHATCQGPHSVASDRPANSALDGAKAEVEAWSSVLGAGADHLVGDCSACALPRWRVARVGREAKPATDTRRRMESRSASLIKTEVFVPCRPTWADTAP
jgi:hypothetical protein